VFNVSSGEREGSQTKTNPHTTKWNKEGTKTFWRSSKLEKLTFLVPCTTLGGMENQRRDGNGEAGGFFQGHRGRTFGGRSLGCSNLESWWRKGTEKKAASRSSRCESLSRRKLEKESTGGIGGTDPGAP